MEEKSIEQLHAEDLTEKNREVLANRFGPANKRTAKTWKAIVQAFGFDFVKTAEGLTEDQLKKKMQATSFSQQLKEKIRQKNLARLNA